jgi:predicted Zn-dependent peptidase
MLLAQVGGAQDLAEFEKKVTEFTLVNGLKFILVERHQIPVVSLFTYADVGSVDEHKGITGMAHLFEHMAFKGTTRIGTTNYTAEIAAMERMDQIFKEIKQERRKGDRADKAKLEELKKKMDEAQKECDKFLVPDEFEGVLEREGGAGLNAFTDNDYTGYICELPSNKIELWMSMESERFLNPVIREFYKERDVVAEERRLGENNPASRLFEDLLATAFKAHPYGEPIVGHMSDIQSMTRTEAEAWFAKNYRASNLTVAIVGDVDPQEARKMAETYFTRLPKGEKPEPVETVEPEQDGERRCVVVAKSQPVMAIGYHRTDINHPDNAVFDTISDILANGRSSRLYKTLVKEKKIATNVYAMANWSYKYPGLFIFYVYPAPNHTSKENEQVIYEVIDKMKTEPVTPEELQKAKTRARASLISGLNSNFGLAYQVTFYQVLTGDWRNIFRQLNRIEAVTAEDIKRVAKQYFTHKNRTIGTIETES